MAKAQTVQRVMFTIPPELLQRVEDARRKLDLSRSELIRQALTAYLEEQERRELRELLWEGYIVNAKSSLRLAEEFYSAEQEAWDMHAPWREKGA